MQHRLALVRAGVPAPGIAGTREVLVLRVQSDPDLVRTHDGRRRQPARARIRKLRQQEPGEIRRGRDHAARRLQGLVRLGEVQRHARIFRGQRVRPGDSPAGTLRAADPGGRMVHAQWLEDGAIQLRLPRHAESLVHPDAGDVVAHVGVLEDAVCRFRVRCRQRHQRAPGCRVVHAAERGRPDQRRVVHAGAVHEQIAQGHRVGIESGEAQIRKHFPHRHAHVQLARLILEQGVQGKERFGCRGDVEHGVAGHRRARRDVRVTEIAFVDHPPVLHHGHRGAGRVRGGLLGLLDEPRQRREIRSGGGRR